jgi:histone H3/H4
MRRVIRTAGGDRVADSAAKELSWTLEDLSFRISKTAIGFAAHAGRNTIKAEDIRLAAKYEIK